MYGYYDDPFGGMVQDAESGSVALIIYLVYYLLIYGVSLAFSIVSYILMSKGMYAIAKRRGIEKPWLAWVPVGSSWMLGCISDQYQYVAKGQVKNRRKTLLVLDIATLALAVIYIFVMVAALAGMGIGAYNQSMEQIILPYMVLMLGCFVLIGVAVAVSVFQYIALFDLFRSCDPNRSVLYLILSIVVSYPLPFFVFACRNKDLGMPPRRDEQTPPQLYDAQYFHDTDEE